MLRHASGMVGAGGRVWKKARRHEAAFLFRNIVRVDIFYAGAGRASRTLLMSGNQLAMPLRSIRWYHVFRPEA